MARELGETAVPEQAVRVAVNFHAVRRARRLAVEQHATWDRLWTGGTPPTWPQHTAELVHTGLIEESEFAPGRSQMINAGLPPSAAVRNFDKRPQQREQRWVARR